MNPKLNKKVKKYLESYFRDTKANSPEHQEAVMLILKGALTDANFHSEAKELGKYFPKASKKYIGTPMEGVIESKGIEIAKMAKWDGHDIIDAFAFYLSMSIGGSFGNRLMSLKESIEESLVEEGEKLDEKNVPTNPSKWSYYKAQAKKKFDVYPSAYANGWAAKQYKKAGGGWKSESVNEAYIVTYAKKKGEKPASAAFQLRGSALSFEKDLKKDGYITMVTQKKVKGIDESLNESATRTAMEIGGLTGMNKDAIQKFVDDNKLDIEKLYQFVKKGKLADRIKLVSAIAGKPNNPVQKKMVKQFGESVNEATFRPNSGTMSGGTYGLDNRKYELKKDVKGVQIGDYTNITLPKGTIIYNIPGGVFAHHSSLKSYESGMNKYFNKSTFRGISVRREKNTILSIEKNSKILESVNEKMVAPKRGHIYYKLTKDTPIKYVSGRSGIGLKVPGVLLHNEYDTIKGQKGAYIINYFNAHFYVDIKNKFASRIAHPDNREQNKALMKNTEEVYVAPDHSDWKKYVRESVNESQLKEFKHKVGSETIQFKVSPYRTGISLIAASGNDLDKLQDVMGSEDEVKGEIRKSLEKKLRIPIEIDRDYEGAGFGFKIDLYSLAKMVK